MVLPETPPRTLEGALLLLVPAAAFPNASSVSPEVLAVN